MPYRIATPQPIAIPGRYYGPVSYYAWVAAHPGARIAADALFDKRRKEWHRTTIADRSGVAQLTVPIVKPHGIDRATWGHVGVSTHGQWWHIHRQTLETAYGRTPFFEFYIDRLLPFLSADTPERYPHLTDLIEAIHATLCGILLIEPAPPGGEPACEPAPGAGLEVTPYYQVRQGQLGFLADLSVLDLIFNLGPEAPIYLNKLITP